MRRVGAGVAIVAAVSALASGAAAQTTSVLRIRIVVLDAARQLVPVSRHALLISDNPATAAPRRVITAADGTASVRLRPGNYTIESDQPVAFDGKAYQWMQIVDIVAGHDAVLELTAGNAEIATPAEATPVDGPPSAAVTDRLEDAPSSLLTKWQASVFEIWTPSMHASGFLIDASGLIATHQRAVGSASLVEVQLTARDKVAAKVVVPDRARDVAILKIDASLAASLQPIPLDCSGTPPAIKEGQELVALQAPLAREKSAISGDILRVRANTIEADLEPESGGAGGPVFVEGGHVIGMTVAGDDARERARAESRAVRIAELCEAIATAHRSVSAVTSPDATRLPVEPLQKIPLEALKNSAERRAGGLLPYQMQLSDFDVALLTPLQVFAGQGRSGQTYAPTLRDFGHWEEYVETLPSVLLVRVSPKFEEGFWTKVARGAASTQGVSLPPLKRFKAGFSRLRAYCGDKEITPIHPLTITHRINEKDTVSEGLYAFDPGAFDPSCANVRLLVYPDKEDEKPDTLIVAREVLQQVWQDFAAYRALQ